MKRLPLAILLAVLTVPASAQDILVNHLWSPHGIALDRINHRLYICQPEHLETDVLDLDSGTFSIFMKHPEITAAVDRQGTLYLLDEFQVHRFDPVTGALTLIAGAGEPESSDPYGVFPVTSGDGGPATLATLGFPMAIAVDSAGNVYIGEYKGMKVRRVDAATGIITTVAGTGEIGYSGDGGDARTAKFGPITGLVVDRNDDLVIADTFSGRVRRLDHLTGIVSSIAEFVRPDHLAVDESGNLYVGLRFASEIWRIDAATQNVFLVARNVGEIQGLAVSPDGTLYVSARAAGYADPMDAQTWVGQVLRIPSVPSKRRAVHR